MKINFTIYGEPHAQERSGNIITRKADGSLTVRHFEKPKSAAFKREVMQLAAAEILKTRQAAHFPIGGREVSLTVITYRSIPKSWSKKKKALAAVGKIRPTSRPDLKNYIWGIEDALNGIVWKDDGQVVSFGRSEKRYTDGIPRIEVEIEFLPVPA